MMLRLLSVALAMFALATPCRAAPLEAYGRLPSIEDVALSPNGQMIALSITDGENRRVVINRIGEPQPFAVINAGDRKLRSIRWAGDNHVLITASTTSSIRDVIASRSEYYLTIDYNIAERTQRNLFRRLDDALNITADGPWVRTVDGRPVVVVAGIAFSGGYGYLSLFSLDPDRDRTRLIQTGVLETRDWAVDAQGRPMATVLISDRGEGAWGMLYRPPSGGEWRPVGDDNPFDSAPSLLGLGREGETVVAQGYHLGTQTVRELNLSTGVWSGALEDGDPAEVIFDPTTGRMIGVSYLMGDAFSYRFFDPADRRLWQGIAAAYPGQRVHLVSISADHQRVVVMVDSPTEGPAIALVDMATRRAQWIGPVYPGLQPADIAEVRYINYEASDGLTIHGYLTLPRGRDPRGLPLVVLPHGGPEARDRGGFDWMAQAIASRGYAVLQPNFRGSSGYGFQFVESGFGQWGRKMQTDLSDGVAHLAQQGIVDPARVCIVGASYGGYAALAGVTLQRGVYRCAASYGGVADPAGMIAYAGQRGGRLAQRYWSEFMGVTGRRDPDLAQISPLSQAAQANAPILLIHGRDDVVVPYRQSRSMADALTRAGRPVQIIALAGEDHWLSRGDTRLQMLTEVVRFLETHNPPGPAPATAPATQAASAPPG